jgi:hypothetical protein
MAAQRVRRLPIMNRQKRLVGMVSLGTGALAALRGVSREGGQHLNSAAKDAVPASAGGSSAVSPPNSQLIDRVLGGPGFSP